MHLPTPSLLLLLLSSTSTIAHPNNHARPVPRALDGILVEPTPSTSSASETSKPLLKHLDLREYIPTVPYLKHLDIRQQAAPVAGAQQQAAPAANANQQAAAPAAAPAAPVAGVGGGGVPAAQPTPGAQADSVTTEMVPTVIGGVTKQVQHVFTQTFGAVASPPAVKTGTIGMGTLTGKIGVVKTDHAKSEAIPSFDSRKWSVMGIMGSWTAAMVVGGAVLGAGMI